VRRVVDPPLPGLALGLELRERCLELGARLGLGGEVILPRWRGERPREWATGKRPQEGGGMRMRARRLDQPGSRRCAVGSVRLLGSNVSKL
jgi:hypothetical protein